MIIKVDVDGVIRNMNETMCSLYNETYGEHITVDDIFDYDVEKVFPKIKEIDGISACEFFFHKHARNIFLDSKPYEGVAEALKKLQDKGHKVVITTWQFDFTNKSLTLFFLDSYKIPYDDICFTRDKWMIKADWLIDDNPEFILDKRETAQKMLIKMPYNRDIIWVRREKNLKNAVDTILKMG